MSYLTFSSGSQSVQSVQVCITSPLQMSGYFPSLKHGREVVNCATMQTEGTVQNKLCFISAE